MKVLMITGDRRFGPGNPRFELQHSAAELTVVYWGRGSLWPRIPREAFDVVTAQDPFWRGLAAWAIARHAKVRLNVQVHADLSGQSFVKRALAKFILRRADSVRVVSEKIKRQVLCLAPKARVTVLPIYIDLSWFRTTTRKAHAGKVILWVGRFEAEKDPYRALEVFMKVRVKVPDARLIMRGSGSLDAGLKRRAENLPVEFPGWADWHAGVPDFEIADVVLSTSCFESFGASIAEALAAGIPVVAPDVGIAKEAGAIVVPRDALADAVIETLRTGARGELKLQLLPREEWADAWRKSL